MTYSQERVAPIAGSAPSERVSLWLGTKKMPSFATLDRNLDVDVAIVGGGITGLTAALLSALEGKKVALLEARTLAGAVSGRTSAHLSDVIDTRYHVLEKRFGHEGAQRVHASSQHAIGLIERLCRDHHIDCAFERVPGYLYAGDAKQESELEAELDAAARAGAMVERVAHVPLPFATHGGLRFSHQAQFHPVAYLAGLVEAAVGAGVQIFEGTRVVEIDEELRCKLIDARGFNVVAAHVLLATHTPFTRVMFHTRLDCRRSYVMAFEAPPRENALFWDLDEPYHYVRQAMIGGEPFLVVGGEDHRTGAEKHTNAHFDELTTWARRRFGVSEPSWAWSAQVFEPVDGLPFIGPRTGDSAIHVASGFSGNGLTFGTLAASLFSDEVAGRPNALAALYAPSRVTPLASFKGFVEHNLEAAAHMVGDRLVPGEVASFDEVPRGDGCIVREGGHRYAAYRADTGALHVVSATCTHLGCAVRFNQAEQSWDCPCHGSRFDVDGAVLEGPAVKALAKRGE